MDSLLVKATQNELRKLRLEAGADMLTCYFLNQQSKLFWLFFRDGEFRYEAQMHGPLTRPRQTDRIIEVLRTNQILSGGRAFLSPLPSELSEAKWPTPTFVRREGVNRSVWMAVSRGEECHSNTSETDNLASVVFLNYRSIEDSYWASLQERYSPLVLRFPLIEDYLRNLVNQPYMNEEQVFELRNTSLNFYRKLGAVLVGENNHTQGVYDFIINETIKLMAPAKGKIVLCWLALVDANNCVDIKAASPQASAINIKSNGGVVSYVAHSGQVFYISDIQHYQKQCVEDGEDSSRPKYVECDKRTRAELVCPLIIQEKVVGVINIEADATDAYTPAHILKLVQFSSLASLAVRQMSLWQSLGLCLDAQPDVIQGALKQNDKDVLQATLKAVRALGYDASDIWDFDDSGRHGWINAGLERRGPREDGFTNWIRSQKVPIVLADLSCDNKGDVSFSLYKGETDNNTGLFEQWVPVPDPPCKVSPELLSGMEASPPVLTDIGFPIFADLITSGRPSSVRAVLWAKCRRHFISVLRDDVWALSVLARSATMALSIRKRLHSHTQPVRRAFFEWHFGTNRATYVETAIRNNKSLLQPRVAKDVIVLHIDIRGSTKLGERLKASNQSEAYVRFIDSYHNLSFKNAFMRNGVVDKTMGDGVHLLFNVFQENILPIEPYISITDAKLAAVETAIEIFKNFKKLLNSERHSWAYQPDIALGAGLVAGEAYVGSFAGEDMAGLDYTVLGAPANEAGKLVNAARRKVIVDWLEQGMTANYYPKDLNQDVLLNAKGVNDLIKVLQKEPPVNILLAGHDFGDTAKGFQNSYNIRRSDTKDAYTMIITS